MNEVLKTACKALWDDVLSNAGLIGRNMLKGHEAEFMALCEKHLGTFERRAHDTRYTHTDSNLYGSGDGHS